MTAKIKYYLVNASNNQVIWDFQPKGFDGQLQNIDGLGFNKAQTFNRVQNYYIETYSYFAQKGLTGEIVFITEQKYEEFKKLIQGGNLRLKRVSANNKELFADVIVGSFKKNEVDRFFGAFSICDIDFVFETPWYKLTQSYSFTAADTASKKIYPYLYDYQYAVAASEGVYNITNSSADNAIVSLKIFGTATNPEWYLKSPGNSAYALYGKYNGTIPDNNYLLIEALPNDLGVWLYDESTGEKLENVYKNCDLRYPTFIYLPSGASSIYITSDGGGELSSIMEVKEVEQCP